MTYTLGAVACRLRARAMDRGYVDSRHVGGVLDCSPYVTTTRATHSDYNYNCDLHYLVFISIINQQSVIRGYIFGCNQAYWKHLDRRLL